ncbi:siderophore-interacting protein [Enterobacteriaceae bacterium H20N1]|uniref:Siderophore-interacting protein n=1 Tax=Dryocola boscaweniae TaxID=2925397 RepID=A0A9X3APA3_9ENTR|nr:siderophore-interacting protein [Dryocola boscaweniae]MCT4703852.1 siderophore-interacting protein [Dryocola boscaweniae]MCT4721020.1 siderophore-interacting protein [Dryocola boscaweniae]
MTSQQNKPKLPKRVKNELKFRELTVKSKENVAECFYRIIFTSERLSGFSSLGFDDHIKVFFPGEDGKLVMPEITDEGIVWDEGPRPASRDYTPLAFDAASNELTIDFYIHDGGVASNWAAAAKAGDTLMIGGPRGSLVVPTDYSWQLYICDESGLPAVRRRLQSLPENITARVLVNSHHSGTQSYLSEFAHAEIEWLDGESIAEKLKNLAIPAHDYFVWITGEGEEVKRLSDTLLATHELDSDYVRAVAYWHNK